MESLRRSGDQRKQYLQYFLDCFMTGKFCDLKIQTSFSSYILCHRIVLASVFPDLQYLLAQVEEEDAIFLPDFDQNEVNKFIHDVYKNFTRCGYVEITANFDLVRALKFEKQFDFYDIKQEIPSEHLVTVIKTEESASHDVEEENDEVFEDDDFLPDVTNVEDLDEVRKPKRRGKRKRCLVDLYKEDIEADEDMPLKRKRGRKRKAKSGTEGEEEQSSTADNEKRNRKAGIRVSKYELFGASKEEKFPPKFLQSNIAKEKTALQKAVEEFQCACSIKPFKSYRAKERHYQLVHNGDKYLECDLCEAVIVKDNFDEHKKACLEKQKANLCPHCGRQFNTASAVSNHVIYVHNIYSCKKCDVQIRGYSKFRRHHLSVHTDPWHCDQCTAVFSEEAKLKDHFLRVHLPDDQKPCVCEICGKGFLYKDKLNTHMMNKHIRARPYPCRFGCDISYNDRSTRSAHEKKKHGSNFRDAQVNGAATQQQLNQPPIPGSHI